MSKFILDESLRKEIMNLVEQGVRNAFAAQKKASAMVSTNDLIRDFSISRTSIWRLVRDGKLHPKKAARGRQLLYSLDEVSKVISADVK